MNAKSANKTAFISGASRGIGAGIAKELADAGYDLALCARQSKERLITLAKELESTYGVRTRTFIGDIASESFVSDMGERILADFGHMDVVINNAGISHIGLLTDMTLAEWDRLLAVNLTSCFLTAKAFVPGMVRQKSGHIIQISSMWGTAGASCEVAYSASKGGMNAFTRALAKELAPSGIRVNAIACGVIDTDMNRQFSPEEREDMREDIPTGTFGTPEDVGKAVRALLSMPYTTGQVIGVDGGYL